MPATTHKKLIATRPVSIQAASEGQTQKRFSILGYTGEPMQLFFYDNPVVVELSGISWPEKIPALYDHWRDIDAIVGQGDAISITQDGLLIAGKMITATEIAQKVSQLAAEGYEFQASIGAQPVQIEHVPKGAIAQANGRTYEGPIDLVRQCQLEEISFVVLGADSKTKVLVARRPKPLKPIRGGSKMTFEEWLVTLGYEDISVLSETQKANLMQLYNEKYPAGTDGATTNASDPEEPKPAEGSDPVDPNKPAQATDPVEDPNKPTNAKAKANATAGQHTLLAREALNRISPALASRAFSENWSDIQIQNEALKAVRASRVNPGTTNSSRQSSVNRTRVLEAATLIACGFKDVEKQYTDQELQTAHSEFKGRIGLNQLIASAAKSNGLEGHYSAKNGGDLKTLLAHAFTPIRAAGFSSVDISGILSNTANKFLLKGFHQVNSKWAMVSAKRTVTDLKEYTSYRLLGSGEFQEVGPNGEIQHGKLGEESFANQAETYGLMLAITRKNMINDDLGALAEIPTKLGTGAGKKLNKVFWTEWLADNSTFYTTGKGNYFSGANSTVSTEGLDSALGLFRKMLDPEGEPLDIEPRYLAVPPELEGSANALYTSVTVNTGGASTKDKVPNDNTHKGRFEPIVVPFLSNTNYTGNSTKAWWLLPDPANSMGSAIEVAFLNGVESPTVETADADFNTLGIQMRGFFDFGVRKQDSRFAVKSKGEA